MNYLNYIKNLKYFFHEDFENPKKVEEILGPMPNYSKYLLDRKKLLQERPKKAEKSFHRIFYSNEPILSKKQEQHLFKQLNYYKYKIDLLAKTVKKPENMRANKVSLIENYIEKINEVKTHLIKANVRLGSYVIKEYKNFHDPDFADNILQVINNCIDRFDYRKDFKFSTYTINAFFNEKTKYYKNYKFQTNSSSEVFKKKTVCDFQFVDNQEIVKQCLDELANKDRNQIKFIHQIVKQYYGFEEGVGHKNLSDIAKENNLSRERLRQLKDEAIILLKGIFEKRGYKELQDFN
jgi:RNA polymerase primary sigma factor/RNA polymerase sigma factor